MFLVMGSYGEVSKANGWGKRSSDSARLLSCVLRSHPRAQGRSQDNPAATLRGSYNMGKGVGQIITGTATEVRMEPWERVVADTALRKSPKGQIRPRDVVAPPWDREQEPLAQ